MDDEAFKGWFTLALGASPAASECNKGDALARVFRDSRAFTEKTIGMIAHGPIEYLDGVKQMDGIVLPKERVTRFLTRIVKGLLRHYEPDYNYSADAFTVKHLAISRENEELLRPFQASSIFDARGDGVIAYRRQVNRERHHGLWLLTFYECTNFLVHHAKNAAIKPTPPSADQTSQC